MRILVLLAATMLSGCAPAAVVPAPIATAQAAPIPCGGKTCGGNQFCVELTPCLTGVPSPGPFNSQYECADAPPQTFGGAGGPGCDAPKGHDVVCHCPPAPSVPSR